MTKTTKSKGVSKTETLRLSAVLIALASGLAALYLDVTLVFGKEIAAAVVAALGFGYGALAFLHGRKADDPGLQKAVVRMITPSRRSFAAIGVVWGLAIITSAIPLTIGSFTITVVDELRRPAGAAQVWVDLGHGEKSISMKDSVGTVTYFKPFAAGSGKVRILNAGLDTNFTLTRAPASKAFEATTFAVWSGTPVLRATHISFSGLALSAVLKGRLPPDLAKRFPNVSAVIPNSVFEAAKELAAAYDDSQDPMIYYQKTQYEGETGKQVVSPKIIYTSDETPIRKMPSLPNIRSLSTEAETDFSTNILGCPFSQPLPKGFVAMVNGSDDYSDGTQMRPVGDAVAWMANQGRVADSQGAYSISLEKALTNDDLRMLLQPDVQIIDDGPALLNGGSTSEVHHLLRFFIDHNAPRGTVHGSARLSSVFSECGGGAMRPIMTLSIPAPELRVTVLENTTSQAIRIEKLVDIVNQRDGFGSFSDKQNLKEIAAGDGAYYELQPGEAIIVPRELVMAPEDGADEIKKDDDVAANSPVFQFDLLPVSPPYAQGTDEYNEEISSDYNLRPTRISISESQIFDDPVNASSSASEDSTADTSDEGVIPPGQGSLIGSNVTDVDYWVGGVRMRARSDNHVVIAMYGDDPVGSCPFVYVHYSRGKRFLNLGKIISDQVGRKAQKVDKVKIGPRFDEIQIREKENEVSYLDSVTLKVLGPGKPKTYRAKNARLGAADGRYVVLHKGQILKLNFGNIDHLNGWGAVLEVNGYYDRAKMRHE